MFVYKVRFQFHFSAGFPPPFVEQPILAPFCIFGAIVEDHVLYICLYSFPLVCTSVFMLVLYCFNYCSFIICFEIRKLVLFFEIVLAVSYVIPYEFYDFFWNFLKRNIIEILIEIALDM